MKEFWRFIERRAREIEDQKNIDMLLYTVMVGSILGMLAIFIFGTK